jgi:hypothetical protein
MVAAPSSIPAAVTFEETSVESTPPLINCREEFTMRAVVPSAAMETVCGAKVPWNNVVGPV